MAYNLEMLTKNLDEILRLQQKTRILTHRSELKFFVLYRKTFSLKHLLENTSDIQDQEIEALEGEIRDVSHEAEDIIDSKMVDRMHSEHNGASRFLVFPVELDTVMDKFEAVLVKLMKIKDQSRTRDERPSDAADSSFISSDPTSAKQDIVVGFDGDTLQLKGRLTSATKKLEIIPLVGMGGIGKTTLARELYGDPLIRSHYDARAWVTVSQDYTVHAILLQLLGCIIGTLSEEMQQAKNDELSLVLYKSLYGKRYLVVVDDIWSAKTWDEMKQFFPKENLRSRILLTTRELDVAKQVDSSCEHHQMHLLSDHHSWELLQRKVFGEESCPPSLEGIGQKIASRCRGLPLAISVIGGVLSANKNSENLWDQVARDVGSVVNEKDENFSKILTLEL